MNTNPDYEPKRDLWPTYEPWMRDLLTDDARVSWLYIDIERRAPWSFVTSGVVPSGPDLRIHPEDCPDKPADPDEELAKAIWDADSNGRYSWEGTGAYTRNDYLKMARAAREHIAGEQS